MAKLGSVISSVGRLLTPEVWCVAVLSAQFACDFPGGPQPSSSAAAAAAAAAAAVLAALYAHPEDPGRRFQTQLFPGSGICL
eukprot:1143046-Pelagomonas_calceolata.AAC.9